jgi:hypothetical protein
MQNEINENNAVGRVFLQTNAKHIAVAIHKPSAG